MPRGGRRIGAGRKPKVRPSGDVTRGPWPSVPTTNPPSPIEEFDAPDDLTAEERSVWLKQAPHAFRNRTLTRTTALAFERYCKVVVLERNEAKSSAVSGANHRGLLKEVRAYEQHFMLIPIGKPVIEPAIVPVQDADEAFFGGPRAGR